MLAATAAQRQPQAIASEIGDALAYAVDPQTSRLDPSLGWSLAPDQEFKPSYRELFGMYLRDLDAPNPAVDWVPATSQERRTYSDNTLEFADRQLERKRNPDLELFGIESLPGVAGQLRPERFLTPYRLIRTQADVQLQQELWADSRTTYRGRPVDRVIAVHPRMLAHLANLQGLRRAAPGRLWLTIPDFRVHVRHHRGHTVAHWAHRIGRALSADGELGLLGCGFELMTLLGRHSAALSFGPHIADSRAMKTRGGPTPPFGYVPRVHDWVAFDKAHDVVAHLSTGRDVRRVYCPDPVCISQFEAVGPARFADAMFGMARRGRVWFPSVPARRAQREHALRARLRELALLELSPRDLIRTIENDAAASPFSVAALRLAGWVMILRADEHLAA